MFLKKVGSRAADSHRTWKQDENGHRHVTIEPKPGVEDASVESFLSGHRIEHELLAAGMISAQIPAAAQDEFWEGLQALAEVHSKTTHQHRLDSKPVHKPHSR